MESTQMIETIFTLMPYFFMIIHVVGLWNAKEDIKEIKHILFIIMWIVIVIADKVVGV
jgi:hypothetical protein